MKIDENWLYLVAAAMVLGIFVKLNRDAGKMSEGSPRIGTIGVRG